MANARTTSVDRRLVEHIVQAIPGDVPEKVIQAHLRNKALSHKYIRELLSVDPTTIDEAAFSRALRGQEIKSLEIRQFAPGILDQVHALGGQFEKARMTTVPGGETLESQKRDKVIKFWSDWHWGLEEQARLMVEPSIASQVIYLDNLVEGSLYCTFDKTEEEGGTFVHEILDSLPKVEGLRWTLGNTPTINRVLANHLKDTGEYLLPFVYTWTTDTYGGEQYGLLRLFVGRFLSGGVDVRYLKPGYWNGRVGLLVLGVPE